MAPVVGPRIERYEVPAQVRDRPENVRRAARAIASGRVPARLTPLFLGAEFVERVERSNDFLRFTGILVKLVKRIRQLDVLEADLLR